MKYSTLTNERVNAHLTTDVSEQKVPPRYFIISMETTTSQRIYYWV